MTANSEHATTGAPLARTELAAILTRLKGELSDGARGVVVVLAGPKGEREVRLDRRDQGRAYAADPVAKRIAQLWGAYDPRAAALVVTIRAQPSPYTSVEVVPLPWGAAAPGSGRERPDA